MQKDHEDLLCQLVEAAKSVPEKQPFHCLGPFYGSTRGEVRHVGIPGLALSVYVGDVQDLAGLGLIAVRGHGGHNEFSFDVSPQGFATYSQLRAGSSERVEQIPDLMHAYVDSGVFRSRYAEAVEKWMAAEKALWATDSDTRTTEIGHLCREALQFFASALLAAAPGVEADTDPAHTVARVRSVLHDKEPAMSDTVRAFLDSLLVQWGCVSDLVQRQEHGALREGGDLVWEDARRVVFQTLIVMYEIDRAVSLGA